MCRKRRGGGGGGIVLLGCEKRVRGFRFRCVDGQDNVAIQRRLGEPKKGENKEGCKKKMEGGKLAVQTRPRMRTPELSRL